MNGGPVGVNLGFRRVRIAAHPQFTLIDQRIRQWLNRQFTAFVPFHA
jgi:hypothetical protein